MQPYIDFNGEKLYLPQSVDPYKFEVCSMSRNGTNFFLLCRKVSQRYRQAAGVVMEKKNKELDFHLAGNRYIQRSFPLDGLEIHKLNIDWSVGATSIKHEE